MTEAEWLSWDSPVELLRHLSAGGSERKVLLYASALCRLHPQLLTDELKVWAGAIESILRGEATENALDGAVQVEAEYEVSHLADYGPQAARAYYAALADVVFCTWTSAPIEYEWDVSVAEHAPVRRTGAALVRDIFGNPFRPPAFSPSWRTDTAVSLARTMYESREFGAMPILADALQDAGCDSDDILSHCPDTSLTHVRGCWVVDLVLGKQ
jgi:hypothetical protein